MSYTEYTARVLAERPRDIDQYRDRVHRVVRDGDRVLHLGSGWDRSKVTVGLKDRAEVVGIDLNPAAGAKFHSTFLLADAGRLPFAADSFDVICSEYVLEHVDDPDAVVGEIARVLRPGGVVVALTPNRWSYKSLAAAATPFWFHQLAAARLRPDDRRGGGDVFPTRYRMNSPRVLRDLASQHGLDIDDVALVNNGPTWFRRMPGIFELGRLYHRALDSDRFANLRCGILVEMHKRGESQRAATSPLRYRCTACEAVGMERRGGDLACPGCGRTYRGDGRVFDALAQ